ncbi:YbgA family protein [Thermodesulfobacteriota bacterium]
MTDFENKITIGVSSCLLGNEVRYDGGHKHDRYITETLGRYLSFVPVCPEVECGLPIPREAMRLVGEVDRPRLVTNKTGVDHTDRMLTWARKKVAELEKENLCGFIFKNRSPSSGMERVKVYDRNNVPRAVGVGIFARAFKDHFPLLPTEEEGRLHDPLLRENFIEQIFVYQRWREVADAPTAANLISFHTTHKLLLMAHSEKHTREMGRLMAQAGSLELDTFIERYQELLMAAMSLKPTTKKHVNVLQHMMGFFKKLISADEKQELLSVIEQFRNNIVPLIVPVTLINHYIRKYQEPYLMQQLYLNPHPLELKLRNHA